MNYMKRRMVTRVCFGYGVETFYLIQKWFNGCIILKMVIPNNCVAR